MKALLYFGLKLKQIRTSRGLTQQRLADKLGITKSTISAYENSSKYPSLEILYNLAIILNVSTDYLLGLSNDKDFNIAPLTDEQIELINELIIQYTHLNNK